jgi:hypothetical protein
MGTVNSEAAEMGVLILLTQPTRGVLDAAHRAGIYKWPMNGKAFPRIQILTVEELLAGKRPNMPAPIPPFATARPRQFEQLRLGLEPSSRAPGYDDEEYEYEE